MKNQWIRKLDDTIYYSRNSIGLRGDAWPLNPGNYIKIITVGGSTTECKFLSDNKTWPERLKHDLEKDYPNIWLNNAGLDGHSTFGHTRFVERLYCRLHPNYILFLTGINDVELDGPADLDDQDIRGIHGHSIKYFFKSLFNYSEAGTLLLSFTGIIWHTERGWFIKSGARTVGNRGNRFADQEKKNSSPARLSGQLCQAIEESG